MSANSPLSPLLSVVVPFYNPGSRLLPTLLAIQQVLVTQGIPHEIIAVSDGSTDGSLALADTLRSDNLVVLSLPRNVGKGEALRTGMLKSSGTYIGFIDADGDIPPAFLPQLLELARTRHLDAAVGSKRHLLRRGSPAVPNTRRLLSLLWQALVRFMFELPIADSQTGIKIFRREVIDSVLPLTTFTGFAFDLELLAFASQEGYRAIAELPVVLTERASSTVSLRRAIRMLLDILYLYGRIRFRNGSDSRR